MFQFAAKEWRNMCKLPVRQTADQFGVRAVVQFVLPRPSVGTDVEIIVRQANLALSLSTQKLSIAIERLVETGLKKSFGLRRRSSELQHFQRPPFREQQIEERQKPFTRTWSLVILAPFFFEIRTFQIVEKLALRHSGQIVLDFVLLQVPCDTRSLRQ